MRIMVFTLAFAGVMLTAGGAFAQGAENAADSGFKKISAAGPSDLRVLAVNSLRTALEQGMAGAEKAAGRHIVIETGTAGGNLKDTIMSGQAFELALLTPVVNAELAKAGVIVPGETQIATGQMGFMVRGDATVDVSGPDAIRKSLLAAKSVVFSPMSSGLPAIQKLLGALGVSETEIKHNNSASKVTLGPGEYELFLYPMSEIVTNKEWRNLGPFPAAYQVPVVVTAVTGRHARDPAATKKLMKYLTSPAMTAILIHDGWKR